MYNEALVVLKLKNGKLYAHDKVASFIITDHMVRVGCTMFERDAMKFILKAVTKFDKSKKVRQVVQSESEEIKKEETTKEK